MSKLKFRDLKAEEIECRIATINSYKGGVQLLLYKDARCDMNILDETVGEMNWGRDHKELKGNMYCGVAINRNWQDEEKTPIWITKWDCGSESYTEKEKGESSDSFKRSCVNWGIGRELYTAPFIWVTDCTIEKKNGKDVCKDHFYVNKIKIENKKIVDLEIKRKDNNGDVAVYSMHGKSTQKVQNSTPEPSKKAVKATAKQIQFIEKLDINFDALCDYYKIGSLDELTIAQASEIIQRKGKRNGNNN